MLANILTLKIINIYYNNELNNNDIINIDSDLMTFINNNQDNFENNNKLIINLVIKNKITTVQLNQFMNLFFNEQNIHLGLTIPLKYLSEQMTEFVIDNALDLKLIISSIEDFSNNNVIKLLNTYNHKYGVISINELNDIHLIDKINILFNNDLSLECDMIANKLLSENNISVFKHLLQVSKNNILEGHNSAELSYCKSFIMAYLDYLNSNKYKALYSFNSSVLNITNKGMILDDSRCEIYKINNDIDFTDLFIEYINYSNDYCPIDNEIIIYNAINEIINDIINQLENIEV